MDIKQCYEVLGISPDASSQQITQAYKDLVKVWNPERFAHDATLQEKAQNTLKMIDEAHDNLMGTRSLSNKESIPSFYDPATSESKNSISTENANNYTVQPFPIPPSGVIFAIGLVLVFILSVRFPTVGHAAINGGFVFLTWWLLLSVIAFVVALAHKAQNKKPYLSVAFWAALVFGVLYGVIQVQSPGSPIPQPLPNTVAPSPAQLTVAEEERLKEIIQGVLTKPNFLNEQVHREFWKIIERNGRATPAEEVELQRQVREKIIYALTTYMKHYYADALTTLRTSKPYKSPEREQDEAKMLVDGRLTSERVAQNEAILQKIAKREPIERNGQTFMFDEVKIKSAMTQLDAAAERIERLFTKP